MNILFAVILAATTNNPVEEVRQAEVAFAKAFAERDQVKFFSMVADDAVFLSGLTSARGKQQVVDRWTRLLASPQAPFSWGPERVEVVANGTLGLSTGPVYDAKNNHVGDYWSIWQRQKDGSWKIIFDAGANPAATRENAAPFEEGFAPVDDGTKLYYRKVGAGPVTIIAPLDHVLHEPLRQFSDIATVITYDMRSRGRSERAKDPSTTTVDQDVRDLEAVRRHLKVERFVPIGFSYLGLMVAMYAAEHPERVTRVIQLAPLAWRRETRTPFPDPASVIPAAESQKLQEADAAGMIEKSPREYCDVFWNAFRYYMVGNPASAAKFDTSMCALENEWPVNVNKVFAVLMGQPSKLTAEKFQNAKMPVLTIHGRRDRQAAYAGGVEWVSTLPDARLVIVEGAAHALWLDDPALVFGSIRHFLRGEWPLTSGRASGRETRPTAPAPSGSAPRSGE